MSVARGITVSCVHVAIGTILGACIEYATPETGSSSPGVQVLETFVAVALNGAAIAALSSPLSQNDPTGGIPFSMALMRSQPRLQKRIGALGPQVISLVTQSVPKTVAQAPKE